MTDVAAGDLSPIKRALVEIRELRSRVAQLEGAHREPIAIVGMGMRLPGGVRDAAGYERLLWEGMDAITPIPTGRWSLDEFYDPDPDAAGKMLTRHGGFLDGIDGFDAEFFSIAPREAESMDPQQRLLLELAWEALEDAGTSPAALAGSMTGVYLGICNSDYGRALLGQRDHLHVYSASGSAYSVAAGRLSYFLGLHGPSIAMDTACSSSLTAIHYACQALRLGECDRALAGGVNLILGPEVNIAFSKAGMMAPDGRCKTFDAAADGYVRSEGCALLVLRPLAAALADGDRVLAVIRGSALNQDGRSGGLTAPNGPAQEAVLRAALEAAGVAPRDVGYVETHGTGTPLGDPIEVGALGGVFAADRDPANPLVIGSVKTNIGHLEAAAGVASLIKVVLMLRRREIPPHLHFSTPSPHIDWAQLPITVPTRVTQWGTPGARLVAGVSSFGFSGTNAHVILESAPPAAPRPKAPGRPLHLLALSARDDAGLSELAAAHARQLTEDADLGDVCFTAAAGRAHFKRRLAVVGATVAAVRHALQQQVSGRDCAEVVTTGAAHATPPRVAFLFTGFGVQQIGMARSLYESSAVFRAALDACAALLARESTQPLAELLFARDGSPDRLDDPALGHPALFAVEYSLAKLWQSWGIEPVAVLGHSLGEYVAACIAGVMRLEDALRLVAARGRLSRDELGEGAMLAVLADEAAVHAALGTLPPDVTTAAYNSPANIVLSGTRAAIAQVSARLTACGIEVRAVRAAQAFHSPLVAPALPGLQAVASTIDYAEPEIDLISNVTGATVAAGQFQHGGYWVEHMRSPVRFGASLQALARLGVTHCIEIGPHPVLCAFGTECLPDSGMTWLPSLRRGRADWEEMLESLQRLYVDGASVDWAGFDRGHARLRVPLPTYPFRHRRYWSADLGAPARAVQALASPDLAAVMDRQSRQGPLDLDVGGYPDRWRLLADLTSAHAVRTLREAGVFRDADERRTVDEVLRIAGIRASYRHLVERWLKDLAMRGTLQRAGDGYLAKQPLPDFGLETLWAEVARRLADDAPLLRYLRHCGELVGDVLSGRTSPLETLFPGGSFDLAEDIYQRSGSMRYVNAIAAAGIEALAGAVPPDRTLRVLEIGAGTGGTTASLLPRLPAGRTRYVFTDVSKIFLDRAREVFAPWTFVEYRLFDLEQEPAAQGVEAATFDVIVAANAVHATRDLRAALRHLHSMLAPGGTLLLVESTRHHAWFDMTTGLIEGWQRFDDGLRGDNPLLEPWQWAAALTQAGFTGVGAWPAEDCLAAAIGQNAIVGRVPGDARGGEAMGAADAAVDATASRIVPAADAAATARARILAATAGERIELLRSFVRERVKKVLRLAEDQDPGRGDRLMDLGFDSLMAVQLRGLLGKELGLDRPLPATLMFDHPTIDAIAAFLLGRIAERAPPAVDEAPPQPDASREERAAAVAAMSDAQIEALLQAGFEEP